MKKCLSQWEENIQRKDEIISKDILPEATLYQKIEQNQAKIRQAEHEFGSASVELVSFQGEQGEWNG